MKKYFTLLLLAAICWFAALGAASAQKRSATGALVGGSHQQRAELPPSTCSSCFANKQARGQATRKHAAATTTNRTASGTIAYVRSTSLPWGTQGDGGNQDAMNAAFGAGNWDNLFIEQTSAAVLFSASRQFVYFEGSDAGADALNVFLQANRSIVEGWVANGGRMFMNAAPNVGNNIDLGFGGITLTYSGGHYPYASSEATVLPLQGLVQAAFPPAGTMYIGSYFSHATVSGPGLTLILSGEAGTILAGKAWGRGSVLFGTMTITAFHFNQTDSESLRQNCLAFVHPPLAAPVLTVPNRLTASNTAGNCGAAVSFAAAATGTGTTITYAVAGAPVTSPHVFPVGTTTVQVRAVDAVGSVTTGSFDVVVNDVTAPAVATRNVTVTLVNGAATVSAAQVDNGSADACGLRSLVLSRTAFTCANLGANAVTLTATDVHGNVATAPATVTVVGALPTPSIAVTPTSNVYTGGVPTNVYLGYGGGAQLTASGGVSYAWSPAAGLSSTSVANPVFTPTAAGNFTYTVTATNQYGCTATAQVTIRVVDVRCGNKNDKVLVCHNGHEICISPNAVPAHAAHLGGTDQLGSCPPTGNRGNAGGAPALQATTEVLLEAYPNPFSASTTVHFRPAVTGAVRVRVYDALNREVTSLFNGIAQAEQDYSLTLSADKLPAGIYLCRYEGQGKVYTQRLAVVK